MHTGNWDTKSAGVLTHRSTQTASARGGNRKSSTAHPSMHYPINSTDLSIACVRKSLVDRLTRRSANHSLRPDTPVSSSGRGMSDKRRMRYLRNIGQGYSAPLLYLKNCCFARRVVHYHHLANYLLLCCVRMRTRASRRRLGCSLASLQSGHFSDDDDNIATVLLRFAAFSYIAALSYTQRQMQCSFAV